MIDEIDLIALLADHAELARLCDLLEGVADDLPALPADDDATSLCHMLEHRLPTHEAREHRFRETVFAAQSMPNGEPLLDRIRCRGVSQIMQAQDLIAALQPSASPLPATTLGYMLRCFFEGCRADMAFEELAILVLADRRLTPTASTLLRDSLERRCRD
ncbi:hypothetical protein J2X47_000577 [Sphingomonas sp. BE270]|jgi:hypothetical protein|uniref:hypothetical protein n=1 Tax=Sphingomonas sp. BE270 TaxID=2817726 RepID=UPI002859DD37|nr:hypothetical protein [Sphingomonas sp. BE270]MDR7256416.1 hypothetical protein [Sphingomonas sp. BE270]